MKDITKCLVYFSIIPLLGSLILVNYFMTSSKNGLISLKAINIDLFQLYCYREVWSFNECEK